MGLPVEINNLMMGAVAPYQVGRSLRFRSSASAYLNRTPSVAGNQKTWTYSAWVKRGAISTNQTIFAASYGTSNRYFFLRFTTSDTLYISSGVYTTGGSTTTQYEYITTQVFRDPSAWYHILLQIDTTQATSGNRVRLYINGVQVTAFSTSTAPSQNTDGYVNSTIAIHAISGEYFGGISLPFDGYLAEVNFIDGQGLTPSSFGLTDVNGIWQPKKYTGTYGTNGFYLPFSNTTSTTTLVQDASGNGNNWTPNNISLTAGTTYDSMLDVPTNNSASAANFAVLNPLSLGSTVTLSNGNLTMTEVGTYATTVSSIAMKSGKWYAEMTVGSNTYAGTVGIAKLGYSPTSRLGFQANTWSYNNDGGLYYNSTTLAGVSSYTTNDVIGIAFDADNLTITFYKNNVQQGTQYTSANSGLTAGEFYFATGHINSTSNWNFGQRPFTYTPPTGFVALNTYNLPTPTITNGAQYMAATTYTGNGTSQSINNSVNGFSFQPDFVWYKDRSVARDHALFNVTSGATYLMSSNNTSAESAVAGTLTSFNSNGYSIGSAANANANGETYVGWQWKGGGTAVTNNSGTITSSVSANASAGFSVVTYTGTGANATVGHGLGVAPNLIIVKSRSTAGQNWLVYSSVLGATQYLILDLTNAAGTASTPWNNTAPTSSVFSVGTSAGSNASGTTYVAYCFAAVSSYSSFGSYVGNGSSDGPFVYTGFRPRYVMVKSTNTAESWTIWDSSRGPYNVILPALFAQSSNGDSASTQIDFLSNGFKLRNSVDNGNVSGTSYIYMAFAESPFQLARAR